MTEISALWQRIEAGLDKLGDTRQLRPPATEAAIAAAEAELGLTFPADLRESLLRHDGVMPSAWPDMSPSPVADIVERTTSLYEAWGEIPAGAEQKLIVADGGDGSYLALALGPDTDGKVGKLYFYEGRFEQVYYDNWTAFLANMADGLESGRYVLDDEESHITEFPGGSWVVGGEHPLSYRSLVEMAQ